jgi:hypothetical protein
MTPAPLRSRIALVALAATLSGCGTFATLEATLDTKAVPQAKGEVIVTPAPRRERLRGRVEQFALMALFAKVVYRKDLAEELNVRAKEGCSYLGLDRPAPDFGMPKSDEGAWERLNEKDIESCFNERGLYYETYVHTWADRTRPDMAVIAIRGTENWNFADAAKDWSTNFAAVLGVEPSEYKLARKKIGAVIESLVRRYPRIRIYTTGHSLGGGIAQQMAYASKDVEAAFAFNSSPVTNWSAMVEQDLVRKADPTIYRIYHHNEFLGHVRNITTRFNTRRFGRSDYEFFFQTEQLVKAHEMGILACHLAARMRGSGAAYDYSKEAAREILGAQYHRRKDKEHPVCSAGILDLPAPYITSDIAGGAD